jgi:hypothetical protein
VSPVSATLLLRSNVLAALRVEGSAVVGSIGEVDGDVDRRFRDAATDLASETEGDGLLDPAELEVTEEPSGGPIGVPTSVLGAGPMDRGAEDGGPEKEVSRVTESGRAEGPSEGASQEGGQPEQSRGTDPAVGEGAGSPSGPVGRWVFLSEGSSPCCGRKAAAAGIGVHTESSAASPSSTSSSTGKGQGREPPRTQRVTSGDSLPSTGFAPRPDASVDRAARRDPGVGPALEAAHPHRGDSVVSTDRMIIGNPA